MAINTIITRGYGNGTYSGTIPLVTTRGYSIAEPVVFVPQVYAVDVYANPTPILDLMINPTPGVEVRANPSPSEEVRSG